MKMAKRLFPTDGLMFYLSFCMKRDRTCSCCVRHLLVLTAARRASHSLAAYSTRAESPVEPGMAHAKTSVRRQAKDAKIRPAAPQATEPGANRLFATLKRARRAAANVSTLLDLCCL